MIRRSEQMFRNKLSPWIHEKYNIKIWQHLIPFFVTVKDSPFYISIVACASMNAENFSILYRQFTNIHIFNSLFFSGCYSFFILYLMFPSIRISIASSLMTAKDIFFCISTFLEFTSSVIFRSVFIGSSYQSRVEYSTSSWLTWVTDAELGVLIDYTWQPVSAIY